MAKNYYEILGVDSKATKEDISKSFKKLSVKWHPDKWVNGTEEEKKTAEEKFKEISEAYSVLSDEKSRREYDMGGVDPFAGFNPFDGFGFNFGGFRQNNGPVPERGEDCYADIEITLSEAYKGCKKTVSYTKKGKCKHCNGTGSEDGKTHKCPHCNGTGIIVNSQQHGNMFYQTSSPCPHCHGTGVVNTNNCKECGGTGVIRTVVTEKITIPKGVDDNMSITFQGKGSSGKNGGRDGNLVVNIRVKTDSTFVKTGSNLIYYDDVEMVDALLGYEKTIECIDNTHIKVKVPELTKDNASFIYKGKGMPKIDAYGRCLGYGDLAYVVRYIYPKKLTKKHKELLSEWKKLEK